MVSEFELGRSFPLWMSQKEIEQRFGQIEFGDVLRFAVKKGFYRDWYQKVFRSAALTVPPDLHQSADLVPFWSEGSFEAAAESVRRHEIGLFSPFFSYSSYSMVLKPDRIMGLDVLPAQEYIPWVTDDRFHQGERLTTNVSITAETIELRGVLVIVYRSLARIEIDEEFNRLLGLDSPHYITRPLELFRKL